MDDRRFTARHQTYTPFRDAPSAGAFLRRRQYNQKNDGHHDISHRDDRVVRRDADALIIMHTAETYNIRDLANWQTPVDYRQDVFEGRIGKDLINRARKILRGHGCPEGYEEYGEYYRQVLS